MLFWEKLVDRSNELALAGTVWSRQWNHWQLVVGVYGTNYESHSLPLCHWDVCFHFQPLYGLLQAKLQLITHAYFEEKDFSQISILKVRIDSYLSCGFQNRNNYCVLVNCRLIVLPCGLPCFHRNCMNTWTALWGGRRWRGRKFTWVKQNRYSIQLQRYEAWQQGSCLSELTETLLWTSFC